MLQIKLFGEDMQMYLEMDIGDVFAQRDTCRPVNDLNADGRIALRLENIIHQILWGKVDIAAPVRIVLAQHTLGIKTAKAPAEHTDIKEA